MSGVKAFRIALLPVAMALVVTGCGVAVSVNGGDQAKRVSDALKTLVPPDALRGNNLVDYPQLKTRQRYARYLRYAKAHGWHVSKRYPYTRDPSGRADDMAVDLVRPGVIGSWVVKTDHGRHLDHAYVKLA